MEKFDKSIWLFINDKNQMHRSFAKKHTLHKYHKTIKIKTWLSKKKTGHRQQNIITTTKIILVKNKNIEKCHL